MRALWCALSILALALMPTRSVHVEGWANTGEDSGIGHGVLDPSWQTRNAAFRLPGSTTLMPTSVISGVVTDGIGHGWPLYASIAITTPGYPISQTIYTNPTTGQYSVVLPPATSYNFTVGAVAGGYISQTVVVTPSVSAQPATIANFALAVDPSTCSAPGYALPANQTTISEPFESGSLPAGWTIVDNAGNGQVWQFNNPGRRPNLTGGSGGFAIVDSDYYGETRVQDTELRTPVLDFSSQSSVQLEWDNDYYHGALGSTADVDVSTNGGTNWTNIWRRGGMDQRGPDHERVDISTTAGGKSSVMVRFHYYDAHFAWWWEIDNVSTGSPACRTIPGGLVVGQVSDGNTSAGLNGAVVSTGITMTVSATTFATPDDPNTTDGLYILFSPFLGSNTFVASDTSNSKYGSDTETANVVANAVTLRNFSLPVYGLQLTPTAQSSSGNPGTTVNYTLVVTNTGSIADIYNVAATYGIFPVSVQATVGPLAPNGGAQLPVTVTIPAGTPVNTQDTLTVTLTSQGNGSISKTSSLNTTVNAVYGLLLTPLTSAQPGNPGSAAAYALIVTNTGNVTDTYNISVVSNWQIKAGTTTEPVNPGQSISVSTLVTVPVNALAGQADVATMTLTSQHDGTRTESATLTTTANTVYSLTLTPSTANQSGNPSATVTYQLQVTNRGNASDTFSVAAVNGNGWTVAAPPSVTLNAGQTTTMNVGVTIPEGTAANMQDTTTIALTSQSNGNVSAFSTLNTTVTSIYGVLLAPSSAGQFGVPGTTVMYTLTATNAGNAQDTFDVTAAYGSLVATAPATVGPLNANQAQTLEVSVQVPASGLANAQDTTTIILTSQHDATKHQSASLTTTILQTYAVVLGTPASAMPGPPNNLVTYSLQVTNQGNGYDMFHIALGSHTWQTTAPISIALAPDETRTFLVTVNVPSSADPQDDCTLHPSTCKSDAVQVTVTSQGSSLAAARVTLTTTEVWYHLSIPIVLKNPAR